jgi:hypothetical protein
VTDRWAPPCTAPPTTPARVDPQLARIDYLQMVERGKDHLGAVCVVAAHLAEPAWTVMNRGMSHVLCDADGTAVAAEQAKQIIASGYRTDYEWPRSTCQRTCRELEGWF